MKNISLADCFCTSVKDGYGYGFVADGSAISARFGKHYNVQLEGSEYADKMNEGELSDLLKKSRKLVPK